MSEKRGTSKIELLFLFACLTVISVIAFIVLNPVERKAMLRDEERLAAVSVLLDGFLMESSESKDFFSTFPINTPIQIGTAERGCSQNCNIVSEETCFNANTQLLKHIGSIPTDPSQGTQERTGYYISISDSTILIGSCISETQADISISKELLFSIERNVE